MVFVLSSWFSVNLSMVLDVSRAYGHTADVHILADAKKGNYKFRFTVLHARRWILSKREYQTKLFNFSVTLIRIPVHEIAYSS